MRREGVRHCEEFADRVSPRVPGDGGIPSDTGASRTSRWAGIGTPGYNSLEGFICPGHVPIVSRIAERVFGKVRSLNWGW